MYAAAYSCFKTGSTDESEMQSQKQQSSDSKKLFGPHAKLKLQHSPPALENEEVLMQQLRERLGPYAAEEALLYHLRAARGKLNWAVNTYFRAVLADQPSCTDFQPKGYAHRFSPTNAAASKDVAEAATEQTAQPAAQTLDHIPCGVIEHILQYTDLLTVCNARAACKTLKMAASSDILWQLLYHRRWHCNPHSSDTLDQHTSSALPSTQRSQNVVASQDHQHGRAEHSMLNASWVIMYHKRHTAECRMQCPICRQPKIVPVVYGFPSHLLTLAMRADLLRMGNDHLIEGQPVWTCTSCCVELTNFPFPVLNEL